MRTIRLSYERGAGLVGIIIIGLMLVHGAAESAVLSWDPNSTTAPNPSDGGGTWNTSSTVFYNGTTHVVWTDYNAVIFGAATPGSYSVQLANGLNVITSNLTFNTSGYKILRTDSLNASRTITFAQAGAVTVGSGLTADIGAILTGSGGFGLDGGGTLIKSGNGFGAGQNNVTGGFLIKHGTYVAAEQGLSITAQGAGNVTIGDGTHSATLRFGIDTPMRQNKIVFYKNGILDSDGYSQFGNNPATGALGDLLFIGGGTLDTTGTKNGSVSPTTGTVNVDGFNWGYQVAAGGVPAVVTGRVSLTDSNIGVITAANRTFTVADDPALRVELDIAADVVVNSGETISLIKAGAGTMRLGGLVSYTGTTAVNTGRLIVNGTHTGGNTYTVASAASLGGSGTIDAAVTISGGAVLAPAEATTFTVGDLTLANNATYSVMPGDSMATANLDLTSPWNLTLTQGGRSFGAGGSLILFTYDTKAGAPNFNLLTTNFVNFAFSPSITLIDDNNGNIILQGLYVIPEPSIVFLFLAGGWLLWWRRRGG